MKFKLLVVLVILSIFGCKKERDAATSPLNYIPDNAEIVIKINNLDQLKSQLKNNTFIEKIKGSGTYSKILHKAELPGLIQSDTSALLAFAPIKNDSLEFLLVIPHIEEILETERIADASIETVDFDGQTMEKLTLPELTFYSIVDRDQLVISSSQKFLAAAMDHSKNDSPDPVLKSFFAISNAQKSASLLFKMGTDKVLERSLLKEESKLRPRKIAQWMSLDLDTNPDDIRLQGVAVAKDTTKQLINLFANTRPLISATPAIAPSTADAILSFALTDYDQFAVNQKEFLGRSFVVDSLFNGVEEIGQIFLRDTKVVVLHTYASEAIIEFLQNNKSGSTDHRGNEIISLTQNEFLNTFFNPIIKDFNARFYTVLENAFVFSADRNSLQTVISHYKRGDTFSTQPIFKTVENSLADESTVLYLSNSRGLEQLLEQDFSAEFLRDFKTSKTSDFAFAGQLVADEDFFHTNLVIKSIERKRTINTTTPVFSIQLDAEVATDPQFVINHRNRMKEIVVQDINNNLYLISTQGKVLWKKQLEGKIQGRISQVDIYKNGRLQLAFTTADSFMIIDRNGKVVAPFNIKFEGGNLNPLAVFDYDGTKNYRFVVTQGRKVFMYNNKAQIVKGFEYKEAGSEVVFAPKHFRVGKKDYLVFMLENGAIDILSRRGKTRVSVKDPIAFSENEVVLYKDKFTLTDKAGTLFAIDQKGTVTKTKLNLNEDHGTDATSKTLTTMNDNILTIKGKKVSLDLGVYTRPKIFYIYDKIYVGVTDLQSEQTYLFDSNAVSIPGFPVVGGSIPDLADIESDKKIEMVTKENDSSLVVYKLN